MYKANMSIFSLCPYVFRKYVFMHMEYVVLSNCFSLIQIQVELELYALLNTQPLRFATIVHLSNPSIIFTSLNKPVFKPVFFV